MAAGWWPRHRTIVGWLSFSVCMGGGELVGTWCAPALARATVNTACQPTCRHPHRCVRPPPRRVLKSCRRYETRIRIVWHRILLCTTARLQLHARPLLYTFISV